MKKLYLIVLILSFIPFCAKGQCECVCEKITITDTKIVREGEEVVVTLRAQAQQGAIKGNASYAFSPVITNGEHRVSLPAVIIREKHTERIQKRNKKLSGQSPEFPDFRTARPDEPVVYSASVPFQQWMEGSTIIAESRSWGCSASQVYPDQLLAEGILPPAAPLTVAAVVSAPKFRTVGDSLSSVLSFVFPESQWKQGEPIYHEDREKALIIYYPECERNIQLDFENNTIILNNLLEVINALLAAPDNEITRISIAGFSSPEGSFAYNDRLAWERAVSVKEYIVKNTKIKGTLISLYNGSEDWQGLRAMVAASDIYDKKDILRIIDTVPVFSADGRRKERIRQLKNLNGGISYRYMFEQFFPLLRNSAFIKVYYSNK